MTDFWKTKLEEHVSTQSSLGTLKSFPAIFDLVTAAMEKPMHSLPAFLWNYDLQTNMEEEQLGKIVQFVLTDFVCKCNRPRIFQSKSERTFWIDRVIPIFQAVGDQTGLVGYEWCETNPGSYTESTIEQDTWKRGPLRNVDGLGYTDVGTDVIVMEASSGQTNEDLVHTKDDTLKNIHGSICILEAYLRQCPDARFITATNLLAFSVQSVCTAITLSTTCLDPNYPGKYIHQECRMAEIPMNYDERVKWLKVFELVSYLVVMLQKQTLIIHQLQRENSGMVSVDSDETVRYMLSNMKQ